MKKNFHLTFITLALLAFILCPPATAQTTLTGDWRAEIKPNKSDKIHISFEHRHEKGRHQNGSSYDYSELQGLTQAQSTGSGPVKFSLVREAGTIECEGKFENGYGSGTFRFTASQSFINNMKSRGFDFTEIEANNREDSVENRLFFAALLNVTTALADDLKAANFGNLKVGDLIAAKIFKIDSQFMREMKATGFPNLDMQDLVQARIFKVDPEYVREFMNSGLKNESFEVLVRARMFKITPEFIKQFRASGLKDQSLDTLVKMNMFKVTPDYIKEIEAAGLTNLSTDEIVKLRMFNVSGAFIKEVRAEGLTNLSVEQLTRMKMFNINGEFIRKAKTEKVPLNVEDLVRRRFTFPVPNIGRVI